MTSHIISACEHHVALKEPVSVMKLAWLERQHASAVFRGPSQKWHRPESAYVYVLSAQEEFGRFHGTCPVLYVGRGIGDRVKNLWKGGHSAIPALYRVGASCESEARSPAVLKVYKVDDTRSAIAREAQILAHIAGAHGEMPPCNLRWEGFALGAWLRFLVDRVHEADTPQGLPKHTMRTYDWPSQTPRATWVDVYEDGWKWSVGWVWPASWLGDDSQSRCTELEGHLVLAVAKNGKTDAKLRKSLCLAKNVDLRDIGPAWGLANIEAPEVGSDLFGSLAEVPTCTLSAHRENGPLDRLQHFGRGALTNLPNRVGDEKGPKERLS